MDTKPVMNNANKDLDFVSKTNLRERQAVLTLPNLKFCSNYWLADNSVDLHLETFGILLQLSK